MYVATNALRPYPDGTGYVIIQTGRAVSNVHIGMVGDDQGESISARNRYFCELTALYWIWKNDVSEIVGLSHHRRFFAPKQQVLQFREFRIAANTDFDEFDQGADIIVPKPLRWVVNGHVPESLIHQYSQYHLGHDLFLAREEVMTQSPEYIDAFDFVVYGNEISHHNMFVARKLAIDEYCSWLFPILFALEKLVPYQFYDAYQERAFGYLAERLFNVWLAKNRRKYRVAYREIVRTERGIF